MSNDLWAVMVSKALEMDEGVIPDPVEPWFRKSFVAHCLGYSAVNKFQSLMNQLGIPTHPLNKQFIRFSSLSEVEFVQPAEDEDGLPDPVPSPGKDAADQSEGTEAPRRRGRAKKRR